MSRKPYTVDIEDHHALVLNQIRSFEVGVRTQEPEPWDHLEKRAAEEYKAHLKRPANKRPRFPKIVTHKSLYRYRRECDNRGLLLK